MRPDKMEFEENFDVWNYCLGYKEPKKPGTLTIEFGMKGEPKSKKFMYFSGDKMEKILLMKNSWINEPVLNKTGLSSVIWDDSSNIDHLRRRLEQKAERSTFTDDEKNKIIDALENFVKLVKKSLRSNIL
ncbi:MAG: hypothetical protein ACQERS_11810 [Bacteroidota bacterium]